jgi:hypothetical protein
VPDREGKVKVMLMDAPRDKHDRKRWPEPDKWQVFLAATSLLVAIIALVR